MHELRTDGGHSIVPHPYGRRTTMASMVTIGQWDNHHHGNEDNHHQNCYEIFITMEILKAIEIKIFFDFTNT